jgi:hypothetical protein
MTQQMAAVNSYSIEHGLLLELSLQTTDTTYETYYISNCYKDIVFQGRTYTALAGFLQVGELQQDISASNNEINIGMSAIPPEYITAILGAQIKGGKVKIYRVFFDQATQQVAVINGVTQIFPRFNGIITNYNVSEEVSQNVNGGEVSHTITVVASSINGVLENRVSGRRTNRKSYQYRYDDRRITFQNNGVVVGGNILSSAITSDPSLNRIETLHNASFDFGKPVK